MAILFVFRRRHPILICFDRTRGNLHGIQLGGQTSGPRGSRRDRPMQPEIIGRRSKKRRGGARSPALALTNLQVGGSRHAVQQRWPEERQNIGQGGLWDADIFDGPPPPQDFRRGGIGRSPSRERGGPRRRARRAAASPDTTVRGRTRGDPDAPPPPPGSPRRTRVWSRADPSGDGPREKDRAGRGPRVRGQCRGPRSTSLVRRSGSDRRRELSGDPRPSAERATRLDGRRGPPA